MRFPVTVIQYMLVLVLVVARLAAAWGDVEPEDDDCPRPEDPSLTQIHVPWGYDHRAHRTLPPELRLVPSRIPGAQLGIVANTFLRRYTWLAEYEGIVVGKEANFSDYAWLMKQGTDSEHLVDGGAVDSSNYIRWINCARHVKEENVWCVDCRGKPFYILSRDVIPGEELLVYYGQAYALRLRIDVNNYYNMDVTDLSNQRKPVPRKSWRRNPTPSLSRPAAIRAKKPQKKRRRKTKAKTIPK